VVDIAAEDEQGDLLGSLALASQHFYHTNGEEHDMEVQSGVAAGLAITLHNSLAFPQLAAGRKCYKNNPSNAQGLHVAVLASSLAMVLRCSKKVLAKHIHMFQSDLVLSLRKITEIFCCWHGDDTIRQVALSSAVKTIGFVRVHIPSAAKQLIDILILIICAHSIPSDIRVEAAAMISKFLDQRDSHADPKVVRSIEDHASVLISTLSTASLAMPESTEDNPMLHLYQLAAASPLFRKKMVKRRCTVLAVAKDLTHPSNEIKENSLSFCGDVFSLPECVDCLSSGLGDNFEIIRNGLVESAQHETDPKLQLKVISLLRRILDIAGSDSGDVMETLKCLAYGGEIDNTVIESATAYCYGIRKEIGQSNDSLWTLVDFTTFPYAKVRSEALNTLDAITANPECVMVLLFDTDMLENFGLIIRHGSDKDCSAALNIARQIARSSAHHSDLCGHADFLGAVVELVVKEEISNRMAHIYAVEATLALLSNKANTKYFLKFPNLLPWLVTFVNTTTADEAFKKEVVSGIVRLSLAFVDDS
jgi:hypothetical protein